ncbi:MAG: cytochrome c3 family protein, partial [Rhodothermales bacterium]|nr:cytochrome c3 family protein [Rhodothermales bacterium]
MEAVAAFEGSIHSGVIECSDCHAGHAVYDTSSPESAVARENIAAVCARCHDDVTEEYVSSEHGKALASGFSTAPACTDCHGEHDIVSITSGASPVSRQKEVRVCESCHLDSPDVLARMTHTSAFVSAYDQSVHGRAAAAGNEQAAVCSDCHGAHQAMKASAGGSKINKFEISSTCGSCHDEIAAAFDESTHGEALAKGVADSPTCTSCHSEHSIVEHTRADSPVAAANVSEQVCSPCHNSYKLSTKYGFPSGRPDSFSDSYHGLATRFGSAETANCTSCHGIHDIWPSTDPRSRVHPANLTATCGDCHPGANENFARGSVHVIRTPEGDRLLYWISTVYMVLIAVVIGGMGAHNVLDWGRKLRRRYEETTTPRQGEAAAVRLGEAAVPRKTGLYLRMTVNERIQHGLLAGSFILLVLTGFMLKFPDAWWVEALRKLLGVTLFDLRGVLHRIAAVVMIGDSLYHLYYITATERGRGFVRDIMFRGSDFSDVWRMLRDNLGLSPDRPQFDRFSYMEKAEYWALIWGTIIMTCTGIVLWFENVFMGNFSKLFVDVNEII